MEFMRKTAGYTRKDYRTNTQIAKEVKKKFFLPQISRLLIHKQAHCLDPKSKGSSLYKIQSSNFATLPKILTSRLRI